MANIAKVTCRIVTDAVQKNNALVLTTQRITFFVDVDQIENVKQFSHTPERFVESLKQQGFNIPVRVEEIPDWDMTGGQDP